MMKNLILLIVLSWVSYSYAKHPIQHESISDAQSYKIEKPVEEQEAQRRVAGEKIKKQKHQEPKWKGPKTNEGSDSEVHYWQYSE